MKKLFRFFYRAFNGGEPVLYRKYNYPEDHPLYSTGGFKTVHATLLGFSSIVVSHQLINPEIPVMSASRVQHLVMIRIKNDIITTYLENVIAR